MRVLLQKVLMVVSQMLLFQMGMYMSWVTTEKFQVIAEDLVVFQLTK